MQSGGGRLALVGLEMSAYDRASEHTLLSSIVHLVILSMQVPTTLTKHTSMEEPLHHAKRERFGRATRPRQTHEGTDAQLQERWEVSPG